ncbi:MAG: ribosome recycling factor [Bacteroidales bacterium]|nr:ribosome recycling factor [Bacteroidales bacterium]
MIEKANEVLDLAELKMDDAVSHLQEELKTYRAGKANPEVFASVVVNYYGAATPLPQMSNITTPDAKTMLIQPWDKSMIHAIEKAIMDANLGFTPQNNGEVIRINVPALTEERRRELVKKARTEGETAKVSVRNARRDAMDALKKLQKEGLPEDVEKDNEEKVQKLTDKFVKKVDEVLEAKEKEIMTV